MAKAELVPAVTKTEVVEVEPEKVTLELSKEEAQMLRNILGQFISNGPTTPVWQALNRLTKHQRGRFVRMEESAFDTLLYNDEGATDSIW